MNAHSWKWTGLMALLLCLSLCLTVPAAAEAADMSLLWEGLYCSDCSREELAVYYDADGHLYVCWHCGDTWEDSHYGVCTNPDICAYCGKPDVVVKPEKITHSGEGIWVPAGDQHQMICGDCGGMMLTEAHYAQCSAPTTCSGCGAQNIQPSWVNHGEEVLGHDDTRHYRMCSGCGEISQTALHYADCQKPEVCSVCEAVGVTIAELRHGSTSDTIYDDVHTRTSCNNCGDSWYNVEHTITLKYEDEMYHRIYCTDCDVAFGLSRHSSDCLKPDVCGGCGATDVILESVDHGDKIYTYDTTSHTQQCSLCGEEFSTGVHVATCTDLSSPICATCGAEDVEIGSVNHGTPGTDYFLVFNQVGHWYWCMNCDGEFGQESHQAVCTAPTTCTKPGCYAENIAPQVQHTGRMTMGHDATYHYQVCGACGGRVSQAEHYVACNAEPGVCTVCGAADDSFRVRHEDERCSTTDTHHTYTCADCGETLRSAPHYRSCRDPEGACTDCGAQNVTVDEVVHDYAILWADSYGHNITCTLCGETEYEEHYRYCDTEACNGCGSTSTIYTDDNIFHDGLYTETEDGCCFVCDNCGETKTVEHEYENGQCVNCGAAGSTRTPGDANEDGKIDTLDALLILQKMSGYGANVNISNADCSGDGRVDTMDALLILQHMSGYDVTLK